MEDREDEGSEGSDDDSEDEDFVPTNEAKNDDVSEEDEDEDGKEKESSTKPKFGRGKGGARRSKKRKLGKAAAKNGKRRKRDSDSDDDEEDVSFVYNNESHLKDCEEEVQQTEEDRLAQEAVEKQHTDRLWEDFLTSVERDKSKKGEKERTVEKVVSKVYDFAGQKVEVQEKVRVLVGDTSTSNKASLHVPSSSTTKSINQQEVDAKAASNERNESTAAPGPSTSSGVANGQSQKKQPYQPRRGGISILGNDPETIGLDELDKRGLTGLLKAFQSKTTKIGTLEKSKLDWEEYKRKQGLEEELHNHNRSRDTFIDKQEFLQRTDYRQFEIEKGMRATARSKRLAN